MSKEHPIKQQIRSVSVYDGHQYEVGRCGITRIEACTKSGMHADIPYIRVWCGNLAISEFCQHNIIGVYFYPEKGDL